MSLTTRTKDERVVIEYDDTIRAWNDWKHGTIIGKASVREQYIVSLVECTKTYMINNADRTVVSKSFDIPSLVKTKPEIDLNCYVCHKYHGQLYPCRICGKVYHQQCIQDMGDIQSYHLMKNTTNSMGWSCPICEDLRILLPAEELVETNEWMKSLSTQAIFNLDDYITTRMKFKFSDGLDAPMKNILQTFLHTTAGITSNRLSPKDLLLLDVSLKIVRTSPKFLVNALSSFELYRLSQLFIALSSTDDQSITQNQFEQVFNIYLVTTMPELSSNEKHLHMEALAYSVLGSTIEFDRTWSQFLLDATISTLLGRYNHRTPLDFIKRIRLIKRSTSPSPANLRGYGDGQSLATLMNNVLQKLTHHTVENDSKHHKGQYRAMHIKTKQWANERWKR